MNFITGSRQKASTERSRREDRQNTEVRFSASLGKVILFECPQCALHMMSEAQETCQVIGNVDISAFEVIQGFYHRKPIMFTYRDIPNHFSFADVYDLMLEQASDGAVFVEIGSWFGASAAYMAGKIRESNKNITLFAIDNFTAEGSKPPLRQQAIDVGGSFFHIFSENLTKCGVADLVRPIIGDSTATSDQFTDRSLDFVYIDACHDYGKVKQDIEAWLPKVKPGGTIAGHDYDASHPGVIRAVGEIFGKSRVRVMTHSWVCGIPPS